MKITQHPTYLKVRGQAPPPREPIDLATLRQWCLDAGADDVGFVALDRKGLRAARRRNISPASSGRTRSSNRPRRRGSSLPM